MIPLRPLSFILILSLLGFEGLSISSTGFQGIDLLHTSKAVKLMGELRGR